MSIFSNSSFFIEKNGSVKACGLNNTGQLGMGHTNQVLYPTTIPNLTNVRYIDSGYNFTLFLLNNGNVMSCGSNEYGQLGCGNNVSTTEPKIIPNLTNVKHVVCGYYQSFFIMEDGTVKVCGYMTNVNYGLSSKNINTPTTITNISNVKDVCPGE